MIKKSLHQARRQTNESGYPQAKAAALEHPTGAALLPVVQHAEEAVFPILCPSVLRRSDLLGPGAHLRCHRIGATVSILGQPRSSRRDRHATRVDRASGGRLSRGGPQGVGGRWRRLQRIQRWRFCRARSGAQLWLWPLCRLARPRHRLRRLCTLSLAGWCCGGVSRSWSAGQCLAPLRYRNFGRPKVVRVDGFLLLLRRPGRLSALLARVYSARAGIAAQLSCRDTVRTSARNDTACWAVPS